VGAAVLDVMTAVAMVLLGSVGLFGEPMVKQKISNTKDQDADDRSKSY
jgi:hypothetical protein